MKYETPLIRCAFQKREKRFFLHATGPDDTPLTAHCPNTGSLRGVLDKPVSYVWLSFHGEDSPRTLKYTHELTEKPDGTLIGSHTGRANKLAAEALQNGLIPTYSGWHIRPEVKFTDGTRFDLLLTGPQGQTCWAEVKNVTYRSGPHAAFPDAVTERGTKHLHHLTAIVRGGHPALQIFMVQRTDVTSFTPAEAIDPTYANALRAFAAAGGHIVALGCTYPRDASGTPTHIHIDKQLEIML